MTSIDIVEIVKFAGIILEVFEGFFCHNPEYNLYTELVSDVFQKRDLFKPQVKDLLQNLADKLDFQFTVVKLGKIQTKYRKVLRRLR